MSDLDNHLNLFPLPDEIIVYRAIRSKTWFHPDTGEVLDLAFYLRPNEIGVSVNYNCEAEEATRTLRTCFGVVSLEVGAIHRADERLETVDVPMPGTLDHAEIRGMPHKEEDEDLAKYFADRLANISQTALRGKYENPGK